MIRATPVEYVKTALGSFTVWFDRFHGAVGVDSTGRIAYVCTCLSTDGRCHGLEVSG